MMIAWILVALFPLSTAARAGGSQDAGPILARAVVHVSQQLREADGEAGPIGFDARALMPRRVDTGIRSGTTTVYDFGADEVHASADQVLRAADAREARYPDARVCTSESPRSCTLPHAAAVFAATRPAVHGDTAEVVVRAMWRSSLRKQPVAEGTFSVVLQRENGTWRVVSSRALRIT